MKQQHWSDCCIGDEIDYQEGDTLPFTVSRDALPYQPSPHQSSTWGCSRKPYQFRVNEQGNLQRYA